MNILLEIYNRLFLTEAAASVASINDAIKGRYQVTINYKGDPKHGIAPGLRTIQIYVYGLTKAGNPCIRAYQPYGDTASKVPSWKLFRLDRITAWKPTFAIFNRPAPLFNPNGDKSMSVVYSIVNFKKPTTSNNVDAPKQTYKPVGQLSDIDKILADRDREKQNKVQGTKEINRPKLIKPTPIQATNKIDEPVIGEKPQTTTEPVKPIQNTNIPEPTIGDEKTKEINEPETVETEGDKILKQFKDFNSRLDNAPIMDLSNKRFR